MAWSFGKNRVQCQRKRIIVIAAEGEVTEPQYFQNMNSMSNTTVFAIVENLGNGSDPRAVLQRMKKYLRENPLESDDEAWIVIDQDDWSDASIQTIKDWANQPNKNHHYALSIRRFEDWLKLHVQDDKAAAKEYRSFLIGKEKHLPAGFLIKKRIISAAENAKMLYPTKKSVGNMFELIETFFKR